MLGQVGDLIHEVYATEQQRSLTAASLRRLPWPDAGGEAADGGEAKIFVELDGGTILRGYGEGEFAKFHGAQGLGGSLHEHAAQAMALVSGEDANLRRVADAGRDFAGEHGGYEVVAAGLAQDEGRSGYKLAATRQKDDVP